MIEDIFAGLKQAISNPKDFGTYAFFDKGELEGFNIHTNSRGGFADVLKKVLVENNIPHGYGELPSIDIFCYQDGSVVFNNRAANTCEQINYEGFVPENRRIGKISELSDLESAHIKCPRPYLIKKCEFGTQIQEIKDGKLVTEKRHEALPIIGEAKLYDGLPEDSDQQSSTIILAPSYYKEGLAESDIDKNTPEVAAKINHRGPYFSQNRDFSADMQQFGYSVVKAGSKFFPKPIEIKLVSEPFTVNEGERRMKFERGDYFNYSRGIDGNDTHRIRKFTAAELSKLIDEGTVVECDAQGIELKGQSAIFNTLNGEIINSLHRNLKTILPEGTRVVLDKTNNGFAIEVPHDKVRETKESFDAKLDGILEEIQKLVGNIDSRGRERKTSRHNLQIGNNPDSNLSKALFRISNESTQSRAV